MCRVVDECMKEDAKEIATELFRNGATFDLVRKSIKHKHLSDDELKDIYKTVKEEN